MGGIRKLSLTVVLMTLVAAPVMAASQAGYRELARRGFTRAIKAEVAAANNIPSDLDEAVERLKEAESELGVVRRAELPGKRHRDYRTVHDRAVYAEGTDHNARLRIRDAREDDQITQEEVAKILWYLQLAMEFKREGLDIVEWIEFRETGKKWTPDTKVGAPECQSGNEQLRATSSCYTIDKWTINIPHEADAAICMFVDDEGDRLTNISPLFKNVIQETSCKLTDRTVTINGEKKRVVRATLTLSASSDSNVSGSAKVKVGALYR